MFFWFILWGSLSFPIPLQVVFVLLAWFFANCPTSRHCIAGLARPPNEAALNACPPLCSARLPFLSFGLQDMFDLTQVP